MNAKDELQAIVRSTDSLMSALAAARQVDPPDWWIGAGAIRTAVWDRLHGYEQPTPLADIDLIFFDPHDLSEQHEHGIQAALAQALPGAPWDAKNQAAVHLWFPKKFGYPVEPFGSAADAVATWPETAACVAVRLADDGQLLVHAPLGLDDLFAMIHRRNPARVTVEEYERRLASKRIAEKWPQVRIVPGDDGSRNSTTPSVRMTIRPVQPEDAPFVARLMAELGYPSAPEEVAQRIDALDDSDAVLVTDGGLIALHRIPRLAEGGALARITALVVGSEHRREGVGQALIRAAEDVARRWGCDLLEVSSGRRPERSPAHAFYLAVGFEDAAIRSTRYWKRLGVSRS